MSVESMLVKRFLCQVGLHQYDYEDKQIAGLVRIQDAECRCCGAELNDVIVTPDMERLNESLNQRKERANREGET